MGSSVVMAARINEHVFDKGSIAWLVGRWQGDAGFLTDVGLFGGWRKKNYP